MRESVFRAVAGSIAAMFLSAPAGCSRGTTDTRPPVKQEADRLPAAPELFTDEAQKSGLDFVHFNGMSGRLYQPEIMAPGAALFDYDNDGDVDLYVTGFGRNQMFRNNGNGTFADVSQQSGTADPSSWGVSAAFVDFDRDGWLDLFVGNYLHYSFASHIACVGVSGLPDYCRPSAYRAQPSRLYRNLGRGRFDDVTIASGLARQFGPALGGAAVIVVIGVSQVDATQLSDQPRGLRPILEAPFAVAAEEPQLIAEAPRGGHEVLEAVAVEVFHDAAAGETHRVHAQAHRHIVESFDVVVRGENFRPHQPLTWNAARVFANRHVRDVQEPGRAEVLGIRRQAPGEGFEGSPVGA
jgi:hypothetical protein